MEGGLGLADVLLGHRNAEGRLPFTVPSTEAHLPDFERDATAVTYDRWHGWWKLERDGHRPLFPFGFGLSYTTFAWGTFSVSQEDRGMIVRGTVANGGDCRGAEVVQVYARRLGDDSTVRPRRLVGFRRVDLAARDEALVEILIPLSSLAIRDPLEHQWIAVHGMYSFEVGRYVGDAGAQTVEVAIGPH
jgi:beta-glucosidase